MDRIGTTRVDWLWKRDFHFPDSLAPLPRRYYLHPRRTRSHRQNTSFGCIEMGRCELEVAYAIQTSQLIRKVIEVISGNERSICCLDPA